MKTVTFYSYKGGTGRSLALANCAIYLARLELSVVVLDFDLEAPGLHYKFSTTSDKKPVPVTAGIVDYLHKFIIEGETPTSLDEFTIHLKVPGSDKPLVTLIPAGNAPSPEYWTRLAQIDWHDLFYSKSAKGVELLLDLKGRIADEFHPDFLLIDARTGITEMGGVATTLLADEVVCLVLPTQENLDGARAVLRSLRRSRRETDLKQLEILVALSRLPPFKEREGEKEITTKIQRFLSEEAQDLRDTVACSEVFVLHREQSLETSESLRVGSGISPDESILLRDYLRLFARLTGFIESKINGLIDVAKEKIWEDPEAALKEVEELAESFGHPETYRALLRFYDVRNVSGPQALKRSQRLWEITNDPNDPLLWITLKRTFDPGPRFTKQEWAPNLDFVEAVWRSAGNSDPDFGMKLARAWDNEDNDSRAADICLEILRTSEPTSDVVAPCIQWLDVSDRSSEAELIINEVKNKLYDEPDFLEAWARHALRSKNKDGFDELIIHPTIDILRNSSPSVAARIYLRSGSTEEANEFAAEALRDVAMRGPASRTELREMAELFRELDRWDDFEKIASEFPSPWLSEIRHQIGTKPRPRRRK